MQIFIIVDGEFLLSKSKNVNELDFEDLMDKMKSSAYRIRKK